MAGINEQVQKQVEKDRAAGKTGFDRDAFNRAPWQTREAIVTATNRDTKK